MKVGVLIGTHAAIPYVHLQLESLRRFTPDTKALVADDGSGAAEKLAELCGEYGADFITNPTNLGHYRGDLSFYAHGLLWASTKKLDLLVKFSRRWVMTKPWIGEFVALAEREGKPTYSGRCDHYGFGFRTEACGFHVGSWLSQIKLIRARVNDNTPIELVEKFIDECSKNVGPVGTWDVLGTNRHKVPAGVLWHNSHPHWMYWKQAREWSLNYNDGDFWV